MAERQSQQINDALSLPTGGVAGLVEACEQALQPLLRDTTLAAESKAAIGATLDMVRNAVGALEKIARPFQHETQMVAAQVDRMYMGFQYQDRISQMMVLLEGDMTRLHEVLKTRSEQVPDLVEWLNRLESLYAMSEQHEDHKGMAANVSATDQSNETTFF